MKKYLALAILFPLMISPLHTYAADAEVNTDPVTNTAESPLSPAPTTEPAPPEAAPEAESPKYGPTKKGEKLAKIAKQFLPGSSASLEQMIWALYTLNPDAFDNGDMNKIKPDAFLMVPTAIEASSIDAALATREIKQRSPRPSPPKVVKGSAADLEAQIKEAQQEREESAQEQVLLKSRLKEMEKQIQELLRANAERDAKIKAQTGK